MKLKYKLNEPFLHGNEKKYVNEVIDSGWLSSKGKHTILFEEKFAKLIGLKHGLAVQSGTAALHTALLSLGVQRGDDVIVPNYTCGACASSVIQCNATPVILDVEQDTFGLDVKKLEMYLELNNKPKVVVLVHVYGFPARDTLEIKKLCDEHNVLLLEDCSEAHGAKISNKCVGTFGDVAVFSLRSEKMIGVGEGGVILSNSKELIDRAFYWASRAAPYRTNKDPYWMTYCYTDVGFNYLMPHLLGAIAHAQVENFDEIISRKVLVGMKYHDMLNVYDIIMQKRLDGHSPVFWLNCIILDKFDVDEVRHIGNSLLERGIEIRPGFFPLGEQMPFVKGVWGDQRHGKYIFEHSIVLPSSVYLSDNGCIMVHNIVEELGELLT